jgi:hypothetical protein
MSCLGASEYTRGKAESDHFFLIDFLKHQRENLPRTR